MRRMVESRTRELKRMLKIARYRKKSETLLETPSFQFYLFTSIKYTKLMEAQSDLKPVSSLLDSQKENIALLKDSVKNVSISENNWKKHALQNEQILTFNVKELHSLRSSNADQESSS